MELTSKELVAFCERLEALETDKANIQDEINDSIEALASALDLDKKIGKKAISKFYKEYKEAQKDKSAYSIIDLESDRLLCIAIPEFAADANVEEEG